MTNLDGAPADDLLRDGVALHRLGRLSEAATFYEEALRRDPQRAAAPYLLGLIAYQGNEPDRAVTLFSAALSIDPRNATARNHRGNAFLALQRFELAMADYDAAIALQGDYAEAYYNRGTALLDAGQHEPAVTNFDAAISHNPRYFEASHNRGLALAALGRHADAIASYDAALAINPGMSAIHGSRGLSWSALEDQEAALLSFEAALAVDPTSAQVFYHRGNALRALQRFNAAVESYDRALALDSGYKFLYGLRLHTQMQICDWREFLAQRAELSRRIEMREAAATPFVASTVLDSAARQRQAAESWCREVCPADDTVAAIARRGRRDRIHIGYCSADFRDHAVSNLMAGVFDAHDRSRFEITALSFGPNTGDEVRRRLERSFDRFLDVRDRSDREITMLAREIGIDIAVDLGGFTERCRTRIFAARAAPLQVGYLGYLGTMAAPYMDYLIADPVIIPTDHQRHYSEKIIYLPSYQANDAGRRMSAREFSRPELGLPPTGFVFCCFNGNFKITPDTFASWMRILKAAPDSLLLLYAGNPLVASNLRREAQERGISGQRLVFVGRVSGPDYLARYRAADLFLDTLPYNAGTTASDALWAGLPVLTRIGDAFAGRVAASLLEALGLPELVTSTQERYEELAVELATDGRRLADLKHRLSMNRMTARLFDTVAFTRTLETAYSRIHERYLADLPPDHIRV